MKSAFLSFLVCILLGLSLSCKKAKPASNPPAPPTTSTANSAPEEPIEFLEKPGPDKRISEDEVHYLPRILAKPEDAEWRAEYAAWLQQQNDPRAKFLRMGNTFDRLSFVEWMENSPFKSELDGLAEQLPEVRREIEDRRANESLRNSRRALAATLKPSWVAFMNTMACPFWPFSFFDRSRPELIGPADLPFSEQIGTRGSIITFESSFLTESSWDPGLMLDLKFLCQLKLSNSLVHPFICEVKNPGRPLTARDILTALHANRFQSRYIKDLDVTLVENLGRHELDEIHNDFTAQGIFPNKDEKKDQWLPDSVGTHGNLKRSVAEGKLWYVALRSKPEKFGPTLMYPYVIYFAVGKSPNGDRLIGVVTHGSYRGH